jgi:hypothetical protein
MTIQYGFPGGRNVPVKFSKSRPIHELGENSGQGNVGTTGEWFHQQLRPRRLVFQPFASRFNKPTLAASITERTFQTAFRGFSRFRCYFDRFTFRHGTDFQNFLTAKINLTFHHAGCHYFHLLRHYPRAQMAGEFFQVTADSGVGDENFVGQSGDELIAPHGEFGGGLGWH